ncbi:protein-glutamate methylesterase/protein-glutamine glutaminase [Paenibacillus marinisediminis]
MTSKKILVVDDSAFMRKIISDLISQDPNFTIAGTAQNGVEALEKVKELQPDAVTLDVEMPVCNGLDALKKIMLECPKPVIMLSSLSEEGGRETIAALENGAFDFVCKPSPTNGFQDIQKVGEMLIERLHEAIKSSHRFEHLKPSEASNVHKSTTVSVEPLHHKPADDDAGKHMERFSFPSVKPSEAKPPFSKEKRKAFGKQETPAERLTSLKPVHRGNMTDAPAKPPTQRNSLSTDRIVESTDPVQQPARQLVQAKLTECKTHFSEIIAVGTSTGGPRALKELLSGLPGTLGAPVLIVQHMPPNFTKSLAERLNTYSELEVREAEHGEIVCSGTAYIAPGGQHMTVVQRSDGRLAISLDRGEPRSGHRPSVDTLFDSLSDLNAYNRHIVLLTGMGSDGARAMRHLVDVGVTSTFAESERSCVVYGMPRAAVELGCVKHVVDLQDMAKEIVKAIQ